MINSDEVLQSPPDVDVSPTITGYGDDNDNVNASATLQCYNYTVTTANCRSAKRSYAFPSSECKYEGGEALCRPIQFECDAMHRTNCGSCIDDAVDARPTHGHSMTAFPPGFSWVTRQTADRQLIFGSYNNNKTDTNRHTHHYGDMNINSNNYYY